MICAAEVHKSVCFLSLLFPSFHRIYACVDTDYLRKKFSTYSATYKILKYNIIMCAVSLKALIIQFCHLLCSIGNGLAHSSNSKNNTHTADDDYDDNARAISSMFLWSAFVSYIAVAVLLWECILLLKLQNEWTMPCE